MTTIKFKCTLLSDVILNQKAATDGPNKTLDFIPGSSFLGIAASRLYAELEKKASWDIFHSGKVKFGDAHPSLEGKRGLKAPLAMYYPKLQSPDEQLYIYHFTPGQTVKDANLKQLREGFYTFGDNAFSRVKTRTNYSIKSAYDSEKRRSQDEKMFGYESLSKGLELYFEVCASDEQYIGIIKDALVGQRHVGRSRSAQYGLVEIAEYDYDEVQSNAAASDEIEVYADSRLIFLDEYGLPKFQPTSEELGLPDGEILWEKSQVRTFQYAPWNFKRQCYDADRCGIEKGSVFVVKVKGGMPGTFSSTYVGAYGNEGFGKVIYNPDFLKACDSGISLYTMMDRQHAAQTERPDQYDSSLIRFLEASASDERNTIEVYKLVNSCIKEGAPLFRSDSFASQWGKIRNIAQCNSDYDTVKAEVLTYLKKGVASAKWAEKNRLVWLSKVLNDKFGTLPERFARMALINLSSEMAKKINKK